MTFFNAFKGNKASNNSSDKVDAKNYFKKYVDTKLSSISENNLPNIKQTSKSYKFVDYKKGIELSILNHRYLGADYGSEKWHSEYEKSLKVKQFEAKTKFINNDIMKKSNLKDIYNNLVSLRKQTESTSKFKALQFNKVLDFRNNFKRVIPLKLTSINTKENKT